jgi:hypothetical protein
MAGSPTANTPTEIWPKVMKLLNDVKMAAAATQSQDDMTAAIDIETQILKRLNQPLQEMTGMGGGAGGQMPMGMPGATMGGANPNGTPSAIPMARSPRAVASATGPDPRPGARPGGPQGAPNLDELRRLLPG